MLNRSEITLRNLLREEVAHVWTIDRSEVIENVYRVERGCLAIYPQHIEVSGWPSGEAEKYTPILLDCFDRGGWFCGAFDGARLVGAAVLETRLIGKDRDQLQLKFLHVSNSYRKHGLGAKFFELAKSAARQRGAARLYISATPSQNTVDFYMRRGCNLASEVDSALLELEPEDIHLELQMGPQ